MTLPLMHRSILGRDLEISRKTRHLLSRGIAITQPAVDATITISTEGATTGDTRDITIQLKDATGANITYAEMIEVILFSSSAMTDWVAAGGSTGIQVGASGKLLAVVAKKIFRFITTTGGLIVCSYLDTGTAAGYLGVRLPNGRIVAGGTVTNA